MTKKLSGVVKCGHCDNLSQMEILGSIDNFTVEDEPHNHHYVEYGDVYDVLKCPACKLVNIFSYYWVTYMEDENTVPVYTTIYPNESNYPKGLPEDIEKALIAARRVQKIDVNAYALLSRRLLELVCLDRSASGNNLASKLRDLSNRGEIPDKLVDVAKGLKDFGNIGAHAGIGQLTEDEIPIVNALTIAILEYIYSAPLLATEAENKLNSIRGRTP